MDEGGRNMLQADYRQLGFSHLIEVYWFIFVLRAAPIFIAVFSRFPKTQN